MPTTKGPASAIALAAALTDKLHRKTDTSPSTLFPKGFLQQDPLHAIDTVLALGAWSTGRHRVAGAVGPRTPIAQVRSMFSGAAEILGNWPKGFHDLLDRTRAGMPSRKTGLALEREFGPIYTSLCGRFCHKDFAFLRDAFTSYLEDSWQPAIPALARSAALNEATMLLNMPAVAVERLWRQGHLKGQRGRTGRLRLDRQDIQRLRAGTGYLLTLRQAAELLGLSARQVDTLNRRRVIRAVRGPAIDGRQDWMFRQDELESLLAQALADAPTDDDESYVPFPNALARLSHQGMDVADLVKEMLGRRLPISGQTNSGKGLARALFTDSALEALIHLRHNAAGPTIPIRTAASNLGLRPSYIQKMAQAGHLLAPGSSTEKPSKILVASLRKFKATHISLTALAIRLRTSPQDAAWQMAKKGIAPVVSSDFQAFYPR